MRGVPRVLNVLVNIEINTYASTFSSVQDYRLIIVQLSVMIYNVISFKAQLFLTLLLNLCNYLLETKCVLIHITCS